MTDLAEVKLWGRTIGAVSLGDNETTAAFEYDPEFAQSGIEVSPISMPLSKRVYTFPELSPTSFHGLPGLLADSLPDKFGNVLIDAWLASQGRQPDSFNAVERLCYTGNRGMGALEFEPVMGPRAQQTKQIRIDQLVALASTILADRQQLGTSFHTKNRQRALGEILHVGTSAGGARAKAVIAWNPVSNEVRSGQVTAGQGFEYWLLKFDGVSGNRDKELNDPQGYGAIEYAYSQMAQDCGIQMSQCRLLEENGRRHFMTRRFDRQSDGKKLHMQSLAALAHYDFNMAGAYSYEQALLIIRQLGLPMQAIEAQFRRMAFNIIGRNQDDHVKNIAFLMDKTGQWHLAPAFDITYSYNPSGAWTSNHQMSMNGKRDNFVLDDFKACAQSASMQRGSAEVMVKEVTAIVARWPDYATEAKVSADWISQINETLRLYF